MYVYVVQIGGITTIGHDDRVARLFELFVFTKRQNKTVSDGNIVHRTRTS